MFDKHRPLYMLLYYEKGIEYAGNKYREQQANAHNLGTKKDSDVKISRGWKQTEAEKEWTSWCGVENSSAAWPVFIELYRTARSQQILRRTAR